ncbi:hypothetical protein EBX31_11335 [bacterium]|nr:hypothetical protein [bacterium]
MSTGEEAVLTTMLLLVGVATIGAAADALIVYVSAALNTVSLKVAIPATALGANVPEIDPLPETFATVTCPVKELATGPDAEPERTPTVYWLMLDPTLPVLGTLEKTKWVGGRTQEVYHLMLSSAMVATFPVELSP